MSAKREMSAELDRTVLSNWAFARTGDLLVLCTRGDREPPAADFEVWLEQLRKPNFTKLLIHGQGGDPCSKQRARVAEHWMSSGRKAPRTLLLTDSIKTRCVLTAIQWLMPSSDVKCLGLADLEPGLIWLAHTGAPSDVAATIRGLQAALELRRSA
jgi:hypothetical protein